VVVLVVSVASSKPTADTATLLLSTNDKYHFYSTKMTIPPPSNMFSTPAPNDMINTDKTVIPFPLLPPNYVVAFDANWWSQ